MFFLREGHRVAGGGRVHCDAELDTREALDVDAHGLSVRVKENQEGNMTALDIYEPSGYLDMGRIISAPYPYIVAVGCRGCGKTYGSLKYALESGVRFMYLRRTAKQLQIVCNPIFNPFKPLNRDLHVEVVPALSDGYGVFQKIGDDGKGSLIGYAAALSTFANLRGFDGSDVEVLVWDEFIPEPSESVKFDEFSAFCNAVETLNRNRELTGAPPVKVIMLSNSNLIYGGIVAGFRLGDELMRMQEEDLELLEHSEDMLLVRPTSQAFREKKKDTALYRLTAGTSFSDMALDNNFTIEDRERIRKMPVREYVPVADVSGIVIYRHKSNGTYYVCTVRSGSPRVYKSTEADMRRFKREQVAVWRAFTRRKVVFESVHCQDIFRQIYA